MHENIVQTYNSQNNNDISNAHNDLVTNINPNDVNMISQEDDYITIMHSTERNGRKLDIESEWVEALNLHDPSTVNQMLEADDETDDYESDDSSADEADDDDE